MIRQAKRSLKQKKKGGSEDKEEKKRKFLSYVGPHEFPNEAQRDKVLSAFSDPYFKFYIDTAKESVLLPIYGQQVPFHISTIKTVTKNEDNLRINFKLPDQAGDQKDFIDPKATFIKEMTFRITNQNE